MWKLFKDEPVGFAFVAGILFVSGLAIAGCGVRCVGGDGIKYSSGSRSGVVQKISKKGMIWNTWEGELNLGYNTSRSMENGTVINPEIFYFSVSNEDVAKEVEKAEQTGGRVTLEYKQYWFRGFSKGQTGYDITGVVPK